MLEKFDVYEIIGVVIPGAVLIVGLTLLSNPDAFLKDFPNTQLSIGDLGLFLILAYPSGQLIQAIGNLLEGPYWKMLRKGWPTDRIGMRQDGIIKGAQRKMLLEKMSTEFALHLDDTGTPSSEDEWGTVVGLIRSLVKIRGQTERIDAFNRTYGFFRGLTVTFLLVAILSLVVWWLGRWQISVLLILLVLLSAYRMDRFGQRYARELLSVYLNLKPTEGIEET